MLPTGHAAAGFITAYSFIKIVKPDLDPSQINQLLYLGAFFGFSPDLDEFWFFFKTKGLLVAPADQKINHRYYLSHAPVLWLIVGVIIFVFSSTAFWQSAGLLLWLCSWSHFLADSIEYGIMWLWPFNGKLFAFKDREINITIPERNFFKHSFTYLKLYTTRLSFYLEVLFIVLAILVLLNTNLY
jgi:hypothetical protein